MNKKLFVLFLMMSLVTSLSAQGLPKHEWRIGWGDMLYEKAAFHDNATNFNYKHIGHFFTEYQYQILPWLGAGMKVDWSTVKWDTTMDVNKSFFNLCIMPEARFTYMRAGLFTLYSGLGIGLLVNGGTETDYLGRKTVTAPVVDLTAVACSVQWGKGVASHWFTTLDLGGMLSLNGKQEIFMINSRLVALSIGYRL